MNFTAVPVSPDSYELGEGPLWDAARQRLLWVDILGATVYAGRLDPFEVVDSWRFDEFAAAVAVSAAGDLLVMTRAELVRVAPDGRRSVVAVLPVPAGSRLNDGKVDPDGRFLGGSMALDDRKGHEVLARLDGGEVVVVDSDLTLSNGLGWSPSGEDFYSIDSVPGVVYARKYADLSSRRELLLIESGSPDGMTVDKSGNLWIAIHGEGRVECRSPGGDLLATVTVDAPQPTSVTFAGPDLATLVITTATENMSAAEVAAHPNSGRIFTARVDATGLPATYWKPGDHS